MASPHSLPSLFQPSTYSVCWLQGPSGPLLRELQGGRDPEKKFPPGDSQVCLK